MRTQEIIPPVEGHPAKDDYLTDKEAAKLVPGRPHYISLRRWRLNGRLMPDGSRLYLDYVKTAPNKAFIRRDWLEDFLQRITQADQRQHRGHNPAVATANNGRHWATRRGNRTRRRLSRDRARQVLDEAGI
jgi:hypothetical protein